MQQPPPLSALSIYSATPAQVIESRRRTCEAWARGLTEEQYVLRDVLGDKDKYARDGRLVTWVLAPRNDSDTLEFLSSCKTFKRDALLYYKDEDTVEEVEGHAIASVYTPKSNRGRGYARHMMRLLHWVLAPKSLLPPEFPAEWGTPPERVNDFGNGAFLVLYSDVGRQFYLHCGPTGGSDGWTVTDSASTIWKVSDLESKLSGQDVYPSLIWLDEAAVNDLWEADARLIKDEVSKTDPGKSRILCTFLPNNGVSDFQLKRMEPYWSQLTSVPKHFGIAGSVPTAGYRMKPETVFATWTIDVRPPGPKSLILTRIRVCGGSDLKVVLSAITEYCKQFGLERIEIWNLSEKLHDVARQLGGVTLERDVQLASLRFYRKEAMGWKWINNEKFCWS